MSSKTLSKQVIGTTDADGTAVFDARAPHFRDLGICVTCRHRPTCMYLQFSRRPVAFCEEFENEQVQNPRAQDQFGAPARKPINHGEAQEIGICSSCETKTTCINRKPGSMIWDCQDYS